MSLYRQFKTNPKVETEGVWLDYGVGGRIKVARAGGGNKAYLRAMEKMSRKYRRQLQLDILPEAQARKLWIEIYAETVVLAWEGVSDENGEELAFTRENVVKVLTDLPDLFRDIQDQASNMGLFRETLDEVDAKN